MLYIFRSATHNFYNARLPFMTARLYPYIYTDFGYGPLEEAIACRSSTQVNFLLQEIESPNQSNEEEAHGRLTPVELAIGWPNGLKMLLDVGYDADQALMLSMCEGDLVSTEMILAGDHFPRKDEAWTNTLFLLTVSSPEIQQAVTNALLQRRSALAELAIKELSEEERSDLGLIGGRVPDEVAYRVYQELRKRTIDVPRTLNQASRSSTEECISIYHNLFRYPSIPTPRLLDFLYTNGFESTDSFDAEERTPLFMACLSVRHQIWHEGKVLSIRWLLDKGACPIFSRKDSYAYVLFYIAIDFARSMRDDLSTVFTHLKPLIQHAASICSLLYSNSCRCYCSSGGCLPVHKLWSCNGIFQDHEKCESVTTGTLSRALKVWLHLSAANQAQIERCYEETFRFEVFDRLGMAHTCCGRQASSMDEADLKQLQEEDTELKRQLDLLVQAYRNRYKAYTGDVDKFHEGFLRELAKVLPDLRPIERCRNRCLSQHDHAEYIQYVHYLREERELHESRMMAQEKALQEMNYSGWNFIDVIRHHFAASLDSKSSELTAP